MPRFAAIDIGSNALRIVVAEATSASAVREIAAQRVPVRLGRDVFVNGRLAPAAVSSACEALRRFRELLDEHAVDRYRAVATSAVREAENGSLFVERARREAGIEVDVIEGGEEARLVRLALVGRVGLEDRRALLIDLGGGSTELSRLDRGVLRASSSLPIGTVRILEAFLKKGGPIDLDEMALAREYVARQLREVLPEIHQGGYDVVVGTGGNFETLAALCPALDHRASVGQLPLETPERRRGYDAWPIIDVSRVRALLPRLAELSPDERQTQFRLRADRADVIVPAAEIVVGIATPLNIERIIAPGIGLKEGVLDELIEKHFDVWDYGGEADASLAAALRVGKRYRFDEAHGMLVTRLAGDLYDQLRPIHRLGERDRVLLGVSALLHDIGDFIRYEGHHRHSHYILSNSDLVGLSPRERTVVANVARYHRKSPPDLAHPNFRELDRDDRSRVRALAAILRVGDALDREHAAKVTGVRAVIEKGDKGAKGKMRLHLTGTRERQLEEWTVVRKGEMFEEVFDLRIELAR